MPDNPKKPKWKSFEESAMQTSSKVFSNQIVKPNQKVTGVISLAPRQIDIKVGDKDFIDIECKDHSKPVDLPKVEQFANKLKDENAKSGIMISNAGFTKSALRTAKHYNIKTVVLIDKGHANTSNFMIKAPVIAEGFYLDSISYGLEQTGQDFRFSPLVWDMKVSDGSEPPRNIYELFRDHWNDDTIDIIKEGSYQYRFEQVPIIDLRGDTIIVDLTYRYVVKANKRKGSAVGQMARGFYDLSDKSFTSSEDIVFEPIEINKISEWEELGDETPPVQPFRLVGKFPLPDEPPLTSYTNPFTNEPLDPIKVRQGIYV
jgi:hypothetical protein